MRAPEPADLQTGPIGLRSDAVTAGSCGGASISVDFTGLRRVAANLQGIAQLLNDRDASLQEELGDPDLAHALRIAEDDWRRHRRQLQAFMSSTAKALTDGVAAYRRADEVVAQAADVG